ncbi:MAG: hypothetical protein P8008_05485 [Gammaproteobacteria bacterium]
MNISTGSRSDYDRRAIRDNLGLVGWVFTWMGSLVVSDKAALYGWWSAEWITWLSIVVVTGLGLWVIFRYLRLLRGMDELQRSIQLNALAIGLGVSLVGAVTYSLLVTWGYIADEEVTDIIVLMCVSYSVAAIGGTVRYR